MRAYVWGSPGKFLGASVNSEFLSIVTCDSFADVRPCVHRVAGEPVVFLLFGELKGMDLKRLMDETIQRLFKDLKIRNLV